MGGAVAARVEAGECPLRPLAGVPCQCGAERLPDDARCEDPECPGIGRLRCPGDPW